MRPSFITLRPLLDISQAIRVFKTFVLPALFGIIEHSHLSKATLKRANTILTKYCGIILKVWFKAASDVCPKAEDILAHRIVEFRKRIGLQKFMQLYIHKCEFPVEFDGHPLAKWSGINKYTTENSLLYLSSVSDKGSTKFQYPDQDKNIDIWIEILKEKEKRINEKILHAE